MVAAVLQLKKHSCCGEKFKYEKAFKETQLIGQSHKLVIRL